MTRLQEAARRLQLRREEFDAAVRKSNVDGQLLALDSVLDYLYRIREYRRDKHPNGSPEYDSIARSDRNGCITEAVVMLRGKLTHSLQSDIEARYSHLYPSNNLYPGDHTVMGEVLRWPVAARILREHPDVLNHPAWFSYEVAVGQVPVALTLDSAQEFLLSERLLGPLAGGEER